MSRRSLLLVALVGLVLIAVGAVVLQQTVLSPTVEESAYGYSVAVATTEPLSNLTLVVPLPVSESGRTPLTTAVRDGTASVPEGWDADVVETDRGPMLRVRAATVTAERQPDGRTYSTYLVTVSAPAEGRIETGGPFASEPVLPATDGYHERPCPNVATPEPGQTCYRFTTRAYVAYDAPTDTEVDVRLVTAGRNVYRSPARGLVQYYQRVTLSFDGPQEGWVEVEGFTATESVR